MSTTFKKSMIFLFTVGCLSVFRMIFAVINLPDNLLGWLFSLTFQSLAMGLFPYLLYRRFVSRDKGVWLRDMRLKQKVKPKAYLLAVAAGFLVYYINLGTSTVWYVAMNLFGYKYVTGVGTIYSSFEVLLLEILTTAMLPAFFEELTDRGLLLSLFPDDASDKAKILVTGLFFGFLHQNIVQLGPTAVAGVIIAFLAVKSGSIVPGMIVHFINNFLIVIFNYSTQVGNLISVGYNAFWDLYESAFLIVLASWALAAWGLIALLRQFERLTKNDRADKKPEPKPEPTVSSRDETERMIFNIYGFSEPRLAEDIISEARTKTAANTLSAVRTVKEKIRAWEYLPVLGAALSAALVTVFSFVWGLRR